MNGIFHFPFPGSSFLLGIWPIGQLIALLVDRAQFQWDRARPRFGFTACAVLFPMTPCPFLLSVI